MDVSPEQHVPEGLRALFLHLVHPDVIVAGDRNDVVLHLLDTWTELRPPQAGGETVPAVATAWSQAHAGGGYAVAGTPGIDEVEEVVAIGREEDLPPDLADELSWSILVAPSPSAFESRWRAAWVVTSSCREWTTEVDNLAGHLLLAHDVDSRLLGEHRDDRSDLLERLWAAHVPLASLDVCLGDEVRRELSSA